MNHGRNAGFARDFHRPILRISCRRCPFAKEYSTRWLDHAYGRERPIAEILDAMTMGCGRHPLSEHRVGRRDEKCEAYLPDLGVET